MPRKDEIKEDISKYAGLEALKDSEGGKELIAILEGQFVSVIEKLCSKPKMEDICYLLSELDITLNLLRMFYRAGKNKDDALQFLKDEEKRATEL